MTAELSVPLCVYDNSGATHFSFSDELDGRIAALPNVASIKIPPTPADPVAARERVDRLRRLIPDTVAIGVSGDAAAAGGLLAGADLWYSVLAGVWPEPCLALARAAKQGDADETAGGQAGPGNQAPDRRPRPPGRHLRPTDPDSQPTPTALADFVRAAQSQP